MNQKLKKIEKEVNEEMIYERYKGLCETIKSGELHLQFLNTKDARDFMGENIVIDEIMKMEGMVKIRKAERSFIEKLLK